MAGVLILLIPGFIMMFTTSSGKGDSRNRDLPSINGKAINANEYQQALDDAQAEAIISTGRAPARTAAVEDQLKQQAVLRIVLLRKAKELGLRVSDAELQRHLQSQPLFANDAGQFDPAKYGQLMNYLGNNFGINPIRFEDLMRQQLLINRLQGLVTASAKATPAEIALQSTPITERVTISLVEFIATNAPAPSVTDEEAKRAFESAQESFRVPKRVQVRYALFSIAEAKKAVKITDAEIAQYFEHNQTRFTDDKGNAQPLGAVTNQIRETLTKLRAEEKAGNSATEFSIKLVQDTGAAKPDFTKLAEAAGATVSETGFFTPQGPVEDIEAPPAFRQTAFALTPEAAYSDPIPSAAGYYVLQYIASKPSEIPPFDQVKDKVTTQLKLARQYEGSLKQGQETLAQLKQDIATGKSFDAVCANLKLKPRKLGPFALADEKLDLPGGMFAREVVMSLSTNSVSELVRTPNGSMLIYLQDRQKPVASTNSQEVANLASLVLRQNQQALFNDWLKSVVEQEKVEFGRMRTPTAPAPTEGTAEN